MKYSWAENLNKLNRAIEKVRVEQQPIDKYDGRVKELYISLGGRIKLEDLKEVNIVNDTTNNKEVNTNIAENKPRRGRPRSIDHSIAG